MKNEMTGGPARMWGKATDLSELTERDHICWAFEDRKQFVASAIGFLREGLWRGMRVAYAGALPLHELIEEIRPLGDVDALMFQRRLRVVSLLDNLPAGTVVDAQKELAESRRKTREAARNGYSGYRIACDATSLVRSVPQRDAFTRFEVLVDGLMATEPFSAMCGYDALALGPTAISELECVHPLALHDDAFHLYSPARASMALAGEVDISTHELLRWALTRLRRSGQDLTLDISGLGFIDHRGLMALDEDARSRGRVVILRNSRQIVSTLTSILRLDHVRTEEAA